jgi:predicted nucleic acid-binding protein
MIVVSNTSPLIALSRIRRLDILKHLFGEVVEMKLNTFIAYITDILKQAEKEKIISSYFEIQKQLKEKNIHLPDVD